MSIISSVFILLLFLSMHGYCNARGLGVVDKASNLQFIVSEKHNIETIQGGTDGNNIDDKSQGGATTQIPGLVPIKPFVSVSRRMPHKNHDEHPGFNSDYSRPRTRPPSHN
ncbi:hypothetical protein CFP56_042051 [Quercus suber]|uniref:Uncharacterized protein n=1 Tax=Quercus suber TaxID=58331 RepID=A0AAW0IU70_QUESU